MLASCCEGGKGLIQCTQTPLMKFLKLAPTNKHRSTTAESKGSTSREGVMPHTKAPLSCPYNPTPTSTTNITHCFSIWKPQGWDHIGNSLSLSHVTFDLELNSKQELLLGFCLHLQGWWQKGLQFVTVLQCWVVSERRKAIIIAHSTFISVTIPLSTIYHWHLSLWLPLQCAIVFWIHKKCNFGISLLFCQNSWSFLINQQSWSVAFGSFCDMSEFLVWIVPWSSFSYGCFPNSWSKHEGCVNTTGVVLFIAVAKSSVLTCIIKLKVATEKMDHTICAFQHLWLYNSFFFSCHIPLRTNAAFGSFINLFY